MSGPFDEARYNALLKGLEISEVMLSEVLSRNDRFRLDSEFVKKEYLQVESFLESKPFKRLVDVDVSIKHPAEIKREYVDNGVWFFRAQNLRPLEIQQSNDVFISFEDAKVLSQNRLQYNDILITRSGANYGQAAIYNSKESAICSSHVLILNNSFFNQCYLAVFLNTKYGKCLIDKGMYGGSQPEISPYYIANIPVPVCSAEFQTNIEKIVRKSEIKLDAAKTLYAEAENLFLEELELKNWQPKNKNVSIKIFSDFQRSGRLDAEYYQPKYDEMLARLSKFATTKLENIATIKKSIEPGSEAYQDNGIPFLRVANLTKFGISETDIFLDRSQYDIDDLRPKKDTVLLSKDGSVGIAYKIESDLDAITSGALLHLNVFSPDFLPDYLTLVLNSIIVELQAERDAGGSIISHWKPSEISQVIIPKLSIAKQKIISQKIQQSFMLKFESKRLLNDAKVAVEREIEK